MATGRSLWQQAWRQVYRLHPEGQVGCSSLAQGRRHDILMPAAGHGRRWTPTGAACCL